MNKELLQLPVGGPSFIIKYIVTDLINRSVNTVQYATVDVAVFSMTSAPNSDETTGL